MQTVLIGCDPEFAMYNKRTGEGISSIGIIPGSKEHPEPVKGSTVGLKIQPDNVTVEMNITPVRVGEFAKAVTWGFAELREEVKRLTDSSIALYAGDSFEYPEAALRVPEAVTLGCNPDQLAHMRGEMRPPPKAADFGNRRMLAGHIHIGYNKEEVPIPDWAVVQGAEALAYVPLFIESGIDVQEYRREFYGVPGLFRSKPYGFEYRTPCSYWIRTPRVVDDFAEVVEVIVNNPLKFQDIWSRINFKEVHELIALNGISSRRRATLATLRELREELMETANG